MGVAGGESSLGYLKYLSRIVCADGSVAGQEKEEEQER